jgi:hypothetical protein
MIRTIQKTMACALVLILALPVSAQQPVSSTPFKAEELEQIVAPVALHPDPLLAQILMASTYPLEVVQAARFAQQNPNLTGDALNEALKKQPWDDSVKSLVSFPQVLTMMNEKLDWTQKLGDAVLAQQKELMAAVQRLRARAHEQGTLKDTKEQKVVVEPAAAAPAAAPAPTPAPQAAAPPAPAPQTVVVEQAPPTIIKIEPASPQVVYVPTYNPTVVYGAWPYPAYPPYYYYPPGYVATTAFFSFAAGVAVGSALWGNCNWHGGDVDIDVDRHTEFTRNVNRTEVAAQRTQARGARGEGRQGGAQTWQHNPEHRKGVEYRDSATQQRYGKAGQPGVENREAFRGRAEQGRQELARGEASQFRQGGPGERSGPGREAQGGPADRQRGGGAGAAAGRDAPGAAGGGLGSRPDGGLGDPGSGRAGGALGGGQGAAPGREPSAFQGMGKGTDVRSYSDRGHASRQSLGASGQRAGGQRAGSFGGARGSGRRR